MRKYSTLLFDVDGTLLDFERSKERALGETLIANGIVYPMRLDMQNQEKNFLIMYLTISNQ